MSARADTYTNSSSIIPRSHAHSINIDVQISHLPNAPTPPPASSLTLRPLSLSLAKEGRYGEHAEQSKLAILNLPSTKSGSLNRLEHDIIAFLS